ncbi:MAG TPA: TPM domain-containing protein [Mycobacteriales bacterium]
MRLRLLAAAGLALAAALVVPVPAHAAPSCAGLPTHSNLPVVDAARVLDPQRSAFLTADLMRFAMESDVAIVAATVPDLGGDDVSSYARRLFDCWGVGDADSDRGVLILVAMRERRVRVELGRGLAGEVDETELSAAVSAMTTPLRAGDVTRALRAAAVKIAEGVGKTLPDTERFAATNGREGIDGITLPGTSLPDDATDDMPGVTPFRPSPVGDAGWIPKAVLGAGLLGAIVTIVRRVVGGAIGGGGSSWRGGFPSFGGSRGWSDPNLLNNGAWSSGGDSFAGASSGSSGSSVGSSGGGSSFGGGSSGGGGASGSW